jgi:hypothetical protein
MLDLLVFCSVSLLVDLYRPYTAVSARLGHLSLQDNIYYNQDMGEWQDSMK